MESWEAEPYKVLEEDSYAADGLLDNVLGEFEDDSQAVPGVPPGVPQGVPAVVPRRPGHQRHSSLAETMNQPLYGYSHFGDETQGRGALGVASGASSSAAAAPTPEKASLPSGRKRISKEQTQILESSFQKSTHLDKAERERVCKETGLMAKNVNIWFQNRRQKAKAQANKSKEVDDSPFKKGRRTPVKGVVQGGGVPGVSSPQVQGIPQGVPGVPGMPGKGAHGQGMGVQGMPQGVPQGVPGQGVPPTSSYTPQRNSYPYAGHYQTPTPSLYRTPKRNSASSFAESPHTQMQKPLISPAVRNEGYLGLGLYDTPQSPTPQYSPTSTLGDFSPAQPFPQYTHANLWDAPIDQSWPLNGRASPPQRPSAHRKYSLMQSPQLLERGSTASGTSTMGTASGASTMGTSVGGSMSGSVGSMEYRDFRGGLGRSKSAVAIPYAGEDDLEYPEMKRRRSNFGPIPSLPAHSTAASSAQVSPNSSPPADDPYAHANSSSSSLGAAGTAARSRAYTQPSLRYESGVRLHLDDSSHRAVLVMVDQNGQRLPRGAQGQGQGAQGIPQPPRPQPVPQPMFEAPLIAPDYAHYGQGYDQELYDLEGAAETQQYFEFPGSDQ